MTAKVPCRFPGRGSLDDHIVFLECDGVQITLTVVGVVDGQTIGVSGGFHPAQIVVGIGDGIAVAVGLAIQYAGDRVVAVSAKNAVSDLDAGHVAEHVIAQIILQNGSIPSIDRTEMQPLVLNPLSSFVN